MVRETQAQNKGKENQRARDETRFRTLFFQSADKHPYRKKNQNKVKRVNFNSR